VFSPWLLLFFIVCYLVLLFSVAYLADRKEAQGQSLVSNPTSIRSPWRSTAPPGPSTGAWARRPTRPELSHDLSRSHPDGVPLVVRSPQDRPNRPGAPDHHDLRLHRARYGNSLALSALVTIVAVVGITPYLGLQLKAIMTTFSLLSNRPRQPGRGLFISFLLASSRSSSGRGSWTTSERHGGLVFADRLRIRHQARRLPDGGFFVTYGLFDGFSDIFEKIRGSSYAAPHAPGEGTAPASWNGPPSRSSP